MHKTSQTVEKFTVQSLEIQGGGSDGRSMEKN